MFVTHVEKVKEHELKKPGACNVKVKYLSHRKSEKKMQLRLFKIEVNGCTPLERHAHEHEVFILQGKALLLGRNQEFSIGPQNVIFIPPFEEHQFKNIGNEPVEFLCTKEFKE